jgi:proteasome assembly chaperone (PAC2) family protein
MAEQPQLHHPWLVAVWPGMGNVAFNAGIYLLSRLEMLSLAEINTGDLFDVDQVEVKEGIIQPGRRPRNRFFVWTDPQGKRDLVLFLGEAQPPTGKYAFCRRIIAYARELGVERVFTFAAMATQMHPESPSRIFTAATDQEALAELERFEPQLLQDGQIGGLNGVLLGAAVEAGLRGTCLLGEMPQLFRQLPYPKASLAILEVFTSLTGIEVDLGELAEQARVTEQQLSDLLERVEQQYGPLQSAEEAQEIAELADEPRLVPADQRQIEALFKQAATDRSKAFELKQELDRLGVFKEYEDRFLDLFKHSGD